ncbi:hypothetical protein PROFUN_12120 [Planoprotostelium fungivorum]|uniref:Ubiquitin-like protease family profile domain-containing protein n=1 Tax=Planoprotostelium fungivorum TaxID=1890364 RepID=A0A2P6N885_9EUKA|nr:hypothetical protein PROFUN_12120 [Planoprotostelium fungivorum]
MCAHTSSFVFIRALRGFKYLCSLLSWVKNKQNRETDGKHTSKGRNHRQPSWSSATLFAAAGPINPNNLQQLSAAPIDEPRTNLRPQEALGAWSSSTHQQPATSCLIVADTDAFQRAKRCIFHMESRCVSSLAPVAHMGFTQQRSLLQSDRGNTKDFQTLRRAETQRATIAGGPASARWRKIASPVLPGLHIESAEKEVQRELENAKKNEKEWLSDSLIDLGVAAIQRGCKVRVAKITTSLLLSATEHRKTTEKIKNWIQQINKEEEECRLLMIPWSNDTHWELLVSVRGEEKNMYLLDSYYTEPLKVSTYGKKGEKSRDLFDLMMNHLEAIGIKKRNIKDPFDAKKRPQKDQTSCGIYILWFMELLIEKSNGLSQDGGISTVMKSIHEQVCKGDIKAKRKDMLEKKMQVELKERTGEWRRIEERNGRKQERERERYREERERKEREKTCQKEKGGGKGILEMRRQE